MKIANSTVAMRSSHELETHVSLQKASLEVRAEDGSKARRGIAAVYESSGASLTAALGAYQESAQKAEMEAALQKQRRQPNPRETLEALRCPKLSAADFELDDISALKVQLLDRLLGALNGKKGEKYGDLLDLRGPSAKTAGTRAGLFDMSSFRASMTSVSVSVSVLYAAERSHSWGSGGDIVGTSSGGTLWERVTATSVERSEREQTTFRSRGLAVTEDGRSIDFDVAFSLSRSFTQRSESLISSQFILTDPLIIDLGGRGPSVSGDKFSFDLDADGKKDDISFAGKGGGFLALDRNGNGEIDDGSELFGTKSGDGFADLAAYDEDGNGWIDENDGVFSDLRVWVRDADGNDKLLSLKDADVGAIYLGRADTEFSLKDTATNETEAVVRKTGVFLKESGGAGTISHVDLRC